MPTHDAEARRPRSRRVTRDDELYGTGEEQRARLVELERDRAAMEVFARVAAHELMEPLILTETLARLIQEQLRDRADGNTRSDLDSLIRTVSRMRLLVETVLLDASSHGQPLERRPVSLKRLVRDSIELLQREIRARDARILAEDLPVVQGDGVMLGAVVTNLLLNALRYGPRKDGEVRIEARRQRAHWRISVISQGPTISKEDRARIFEPYHRGTHERRVAGAGLGLAICRSFVERHDGVIGVAPVRAGGNRFYFTIPEIERSTGKASVTPPR
jgi:signal transduction histidine kinase